MHKARTVRSIQRYERLLERDARWLATTYFRWLPRFLWPFVLCEEDAGGSVSICIRFPRLVLLRLARQADRSGPGREMFFIVGGLLASRRAESRGRMEFRDVLGGRYTIVAIHDFEPYLPWNFYHATQAVAHGFVMRAFRRHVTRLARR